MALALVPPGFAVLIIPGLLNWDHTRMTIPHCALMSFRGSIQHRATLALRGEQQGRGQEAVSPNMAVEEPRLMAAST